jgi:2-iminobutanoate/2-iminopropanoate deaminase
MTTNIAHNPADAFPPYRNYAHAVEVPPGSRTLYISGLNGYDRTGTVMPDSFGEQARNIWAHLRTILASAGMTYADLVSLRFFLASADFDPENVAILSEHLDTTVAARTVVVQSLLEPEWLVEIEAVAARTD